MHLDSRVVQIDWCNYLLGVSTLTRCYLCNTSLEHYKQIGQKLRDGEFGICFVNSNPEANCFVSEDGTTNDQCETSDEFSSSVRDNGFSLLAEHEMFGEIDFGARGRDAYKDLRAYCARPGARLWEVDASGTVLNTHQFKQALAVAPTKILSRVQRCESYSSRSSYSNAAVNSGSSPAHSYQPFQFTKLHTLSKKFIFTFTRDGMYIFDPSKGEVVLWSDSFKDIVDSKVVGDNVYVCLSNGTIHVLTLAPLEKCVLRLYFRKHYELCGELCLLYNNYLTTKAPVSRKLHFLGDLGDKLKDIGIFELSDKIKPLVQEIVKFAQEKKKAQKMKSGIYLVGNVHKMKTELALGTHSKNGVGNMKGVFSSNTPSGIPRLKSRSLNSSPESLRKSKLSQKLPKQCFSTSSSPERRSADRTGSVESVVETRSRIRSDDELREQEQECISSSTSSLASNDAGDYSKNWAIPDTDAISLAIYNGPQNISALADLTDAFASKLTVGTRTLKEKWNAVEMKIRMLVQDAVPEPFDVGTFTDVEVNGIQQEMDAEVCLGDIVLKQKSVNLAQLNGQLQKPSHQKLATYPELDVLKICSLCEENRRVVENGSMSLDVRKHLEIEIVDSLLSLYLVYVQCDTKTKESLPCVDKDRIHYFLKTNTSDIVVFPCTHYFQHNDMELLSAILKDYFSQPSFRSRILTFADDYFSVERIPNVVNEVQSKDDIKMDVVYGRLAIAFYDLLRPGLNAIFDKSYLTSSKFFIWSSIIERAQEKALSFVAAEDVSALRDVLSSGDHSLPVLLNVIFFLLRVNLWKTIDICVAQKEKIVVKNVMYLVFRYELLDEHFNNGLRKTLEVKQQSCTFFLAYLNGLLNTRAVDELGEDPIDASFNDEETLRFAISAFVGISRESDLQNTCACGWPQPGCLRTSVKFTEIGEKILLHTWNTRRDKQTCVEFCQNSSSLHLWCKYAELLKESGDDDCKSRVLPIVVQTGSLVLWKCLLDLSSRESWKTIFDLRLQMCVNGSEDKLVCLGCKNQLECESALSWSSLATHMLKTLDIGMTLQLMVNYSDRIPHGQLTERFYKMFLCCGMAGSLGDPSKQAHIMQKLEGTGTDQKAMLSHEVEKQVLSEVKRERWHLLKNPSSSGGTDEAEHHWGVRVQFRGAVCLRCTLPLSTPVLLREGGVVVFDCKHVYHEICIRQCQFACFVCNTRRRSSLFKPKRIV